MKRRAFVLAAAVTASFGQIAIAADLPARRAPLPYEPPIPVFTWTGFYVGANAGYIFDAGQASRIAGENGLEVNIADGVRPGYGHLLSNGFIGGGQIGYNYQLGNLPMFGNGFGARSGSVVVGIEADASYTHDSRSADYFSDRLSTFSSRTDFIGTVRGRLGYAFGNVLVYGTGGFAYGNVASTATFFGPAGNLTYAGAANQIRTGYAYGGGVEYAIPTASFLNPFHASAVTVKAEFIRYELGPYNLRIGNTNGQISGYDQTIRASGDIVRAGLNYKFGSVAATPVVARY